MERRLRFGRHRVDELDGLNVGLDHAVELLQRLHVALRFGQPRDLTQIRRVAQDLALKVVQLVESVLLVARIDPQIQVIRLDMLAKLFEPGAHLLDVFRGALNVLEG